MLRAAVEEGSARAAAILGLVYDQGSAVDRDEVRANELFRLAASPDAFDGPCNLAAVALANREVGRYFGVSTDISKAVELYRIASERGDADALFEVGAAFADGKGVERDEAEAVALWRQAAAKDEVRAVFNLGVAYEQGRGVPRDEVAALGHYRVGSELGHAPSTHNLAVMYMEGIGGLSKDESKAVELYKRAANLGHAAAAYTAPKVSAPSSSMHARLEGTG